MRCKESAIILRYGQLLDNLISHVSDLTKTLCESLKADNNFVWLKHHQSAFQGIKDTISKDTALRYYDATQDLYLEVDVSQVGLSTVILQSQTDQISNNSDNGFIPTDLYLRVSPLLNKTIQI